MFLGGFNGFLTVYTRIFAFLIIFNCVCKGLEIG